MWRNAATDPLGSDTRAGVQTYDDLYADTRKWVRKGWIDYIVPAALLEHRLRRRRLREAGALVGEVVRGHRAQLYVGEALYKAGDPAQPAAWQDPAELSRHLTFAEDYAQVRGHVFFSAKEVAADPIGAMARVVADHYQQPAMPPR